MIIPDITVSPLLFQVRTIGTETAFSIDELEELYVLFKVSYMLDVYKG